MSCKTHFIISPDGQERVIFNDWPDDAMCLCTFSADDRPLDVADVRALALLGAAAALIRRGELRGDPDHGYVVLPDAIPTWLVAAIDRFLSTAAIAEEKRAIAERLRAMADRVARDDGMIAEAIRCFAMDLSPVTDEAPPTRAEGTP